MVLLYFMIKGFLLYHRILSSFETKKSSSPKKIKENHQQLLSIFCPDSRQAPEGKTTGTRVALQQCAGAKEAMLY
jgi:hypothetical protein